MAMKSGVMEGVIISIMAIIINQKRNVNNNGNTIMASA